VASIIW